MSFGNPFRNVTERITPAKAVKVSKLRSESLKRLVASLECMKCGKELRTQAAHGNQDKAMASKTGDETLFAVCVECHAEIDQGGSMPKAVRRDLERELNHKTLQTLVARGLLVPR